ncbi:MAG: OmpA family protein [Deltaproteobacteria bacterium]|nr:OmpA family protein [Deltaproteobacteria bacterium]
MTTTRTIVLALVAVLLAGGAAFAQEGIDLQTFRPSIFNGNFLAIEDAHTLDAMCYGFGLYANHANSVFQLEKNDEFESGVLNQITTLNLTLAVAPWSWLSLGVDIPYHVAARAKRFKKVEADVFAGEDAEGELLEDQSTLGDIKAEIKLGILKEENVGLGLALAGFGTFPTGDPEIFLGEGTTNGGGKLILEKDLSIFNIAANGGYLVRSERDVFGATIGNAYIFGGGISRTIVGGLSFSLEYWGQSADSTSYNKFQANPTELTGTLRYRFGNGLRFIGGGGAGAGEGAGSPAYRMIAGIDYYPHCEGPTQGVLIVRVTDEAGNPLSAGLKVTGAKAFGVDTDAAGEYQATVDPGTYDVAASKEGYEDGAGSGTVKVGKTTTVLIVLNEIKKTTLAVNVVSAKDKKPLPGATATLVNKATGAKKLMGLGDGTWSGEYTPGQYDVTGSLAGYADGAASVNVVEGQANAVTVVLQKKIIPIGKILFYFDSNKIRPVSFPVLEDVLVKVNDELATGGFKTLYIQGHCSSEGTDAYNDGLSKRRAAAVRQWLIDHGISASLLVSEGFGEGKPIAPNDTEANRELNRRVEFIFEY